MADQQSYVNINNTQSTEEIFLLPNVYTEANSTKSKGVTDEEPAELDEPASEQADLFSNDEQTSTIPEKESARISSGLFPAPPSNGNTVQEPKIKRTPSVKQQYPGRTSAMEYRMKAIENLLTELTTAPMPTTPLPSPPLPAMPQSTAPSPSTPQSTTPRSNTPQSDTPRSITPRQTAPPPNSQEDETSPPSPEGKAEVLTSSAPSTQALQLPPPQLPPPHLPPPFLPPSKFSTKAPQLPLPDFSPPELPSSELPPLPASPPSGLPAHAPRIPTPELPAPGPPTQAPKLPPSGPAQMRNASPITQQSVAAPGRQESFNTPPLSQRSHMEFGELCSLFKKCQMAISSDRKQAYRVVDVSVPVENDTSKGALSIGCIHLDYDGQSVGPVHTKFKIRKYKGRQRVASLPIHAFCMNSDPAGVRETLVGRGRNFVKVSAGKHMYCRGTSFTSREHVDGQVMVDFQQAIRRNPHWTPAIIGAASNIDEDEDDVWESIQAAGIPDSLLQLREIGHGDAKLSDDELMLLSHRVFGFILRTRKWAAFDISELHEMHDKTGSEGFKRLALPRGHREKLEPLLRQHFRQRQSIKDDISSEIDFFRREQLGLTILLHGVPGVGKTLTAECVASHFSRPLFPLSYNDLLGGAPAEVTAQLEEVFALAAAWDAVLLVEDAEPLLFPPSGDDYIRNTSPAAAAAFLRVVDNYPGLLFLTTTTTSGSSSGSRVNNALHSRLRLSLFYPPLDERATLDVWDIGIWQAKRQHPSMRIKADEVLNFAAERHHYHSHHHPAGRWNGRQIRNAFWNAIALAEDEASYSSGNGSGGGSGGGSSIREKREQRRKSLRSTTTTTTVTLRRRHFELVAEASEDFDDSVAAVGGQQPQQAPLPLPPPPPPPPKFRHERQDSSSSFFREAERQRSRTITTTERPATALVRSNTLPTGGGGGGGGSFEPQQQQRRRGTTVVSRAFTPGLPPLPKLPRMTAAAEQQPPLPPLPAGQSAGRSARQTTTTMHVRRHSQLSIAQQQQQQQQQERLHSREPSGSGGGGGGRYASSTRNVKVAPAQQQKRRSRSGEISEGEDDWSETRQDSGAEEWTNAEVERNLIDNFTTIAYK